MTKDRPLAAWVGAYANERVQQGVAAFAIPTAIGAFAAMKWGWMAFAAGGAIGVIGAGVVAMMARGDAADKSSVDLADVKENPMAANYAASFALITQPDVFAVHMNILAGQLEAAGYMLAATQARKAAADVGATP